MFKRHCRLNLQVLQRQNVATANPQRIQNIQGCTGYKSDLRFIFVRALYLYCLFQKVLDVEFKKYNIPILHNVFLAFLAVAAGFFDFLFRAVFKEVVKTVDFRFNESSFKVGVDNAGRLGCGISCMNCPCAAFVFPGGKEGT